jgi:hypothetical protein
MEASSRRVELGYEDEYLHWSRHSSQIVFTEFKEASAL